MNSPASSPAAQLALKQITTPSTAADLMQAQGLGLIWFGAPPAHWAQTQALLPAMSVPLPPLDATLNAGTGELWLGATPGAMQEFEGISYRCDGQSLFGMIENDSAASGLNDQTKSAYERMFRLLAKTGYAHLWRTWNFIQDIHAEEPAPEPVLTPVLAAAQPEAHHQNHPALERYRQFNLGRQAAYDAFAQSAAHTAPAACALGMHAGGFCFAFLAGKIAPILLENPRQTSAYYYPSTYGPRSPTFSRAALIPLKPHALLLISGTASIVGHESRHIGNVRAQTRETITNLSEIVAQANDHLPEGERFALAQLNFRVYVRRPADADAVRRELRVCLGKHITACFVQADVCRQELLMEIEASGFCAPI